MHPPPKNQTPDRLVFVHLLYRTRSYTFHARSHQGQLCGI